MINDVTLVAPWIEKSFPIIRIVLFCLVAICAIVIIITTLLQNDDGNSADVITGAQESYYSKNKGGSRDGKLKLATIICASICAVCVLLYLITVLVYNPTL